MASRESLFIGIDVSKQKLDVAFGADPHAPRSGFNRRVTNVNSAYTLSVPAHHRTRDWPNVTALLYHFCGRGGSTYFDILSSILHVRLPGSRFSVPGSQFLERDQKRTSRIKPIQEHCDRTEIKEGFA